jgi:sugar-phosphatase
METFDAVLFDLFGTLVTERAEPIEGARELLQAMPHGRWAIVTSCPKALAQRLISQAALPVPPLIVSSDDVARSKPAPDCYLLAAERLQALPARCLVLEDSRQGVAAAVAAGMTVIALAGTRSFALERGDVRVVGELKDVQLDVTQSGAIALR